MFMTYDEFEKKYLGKAIDYDGSAGVQCVDLADQYFKDCFGITGVWVSGARDFYNKFSAYPALVKAFDRIPNTRDLVIKKGDVVIWGGGNWGHVAIGNGKGDKDYFVALEQNTLGKHEPTQLVKHYFNGSGGADGCNPVLGVLRPKSVAKPLKVLDESGMKRGDKSLGVLAYKQLLMIAFRKQIVTARVDNNKGFGGGTEQNTNELLKRLGYKQNGIAGEGLVKALGEMLTK